MNICLPPRIPHVAGALLALGAAVGLGISPITGRAQEAARPATSDAGEAGIHPGDLVRLMVWRHEDLTGEFEVNEYGTVVLPKLGEIDVTRETHRSLRDRVIRGLRETIVTDAIEVVVLKRVRVLGEVNEPGVYHLSPTMTVADALASAGGATPDARQGIVALRRGSETIVADLRLDAQLSETPIQSRDELYVPRRSWLSRNTGTIVTGVGAVVGLIVAIVSAGGGS